MRIGEVSHRSGVSVRMLRHYDALGLVSPQARTATGYRDYAERDLRRILHVEALRSLGMGLADVAEVLEDADPHDPSAVLDELIERTRSRIAAEQELLGRLEHTRSRAPERWVDVLRTVALLRAVRSDDPRERQQAALSPDSTLPASALVEAALAEDETNTAGAVRWALARAAAYDDAPLALLEEALGSASVQERRRAVGLLADLPALADRPGRDAMTLLVRALVDTDAEVRSRAARALASRIGGSTDGARVGSDRAEAAVVLRDELVRMIVDGDHDVEAAEGLAGLVAAGAATTSAVVDVLSQHMRDGDTSSAGRQRAVQALGELRGPRVREALSALTDDADPVVARIAAYVAGRLPPDGSEFAPRCR
ncbi:MerR family transcriptional regulator [Brevibacterium yomogidense]|uniref:Transcriptional regulator, MerR family n=1 Tax=Brevibacterium yomogidense TaxID=946573 RepID=A0A1X6WXS2_9MICO|nr:MerR family transcriptional regulator [Brevibacterium yomogidense]SLM90702.1 Transcriptional regulator, MerR family [Brevibacterium yomogidense]